MVSYSPNEVKSTATFVLSAVPTVLEIQWSQRRHDELYHPDILALSVHNRLKHMTLHFAKYVGAMLDPCLETDKKNVLLVDAFIIVLASANALNLDLGATMGVTTASLADVTNFWTKTWSKAGANADEPFISRFAVEAGKMAKYCESLDHLERGDFGSALRESIAQIFKMIVTQAAEINIDLVGARLERLSNIERCALFHKFIGD